MQAFEKVNILEGKISLLLEQIITWRKRFFWLVWLFPVIMTPSLFSPSLEDLTLIGISDLRKIEEKISMLNTSLHFYNVHSSCHYFSHGKSLVSGTCPWQLMVPDVLLPGRIWEHLH